MQWSVCKESAVMGHSVTLQSLQETPDRLRYRWRKENQRLSSTPAGKLEHATRAWLTPMITNRHQNNLKATWSCLPINTNDGTIWQRMARWAAVDIPLVITWWMAALPAVPARDQSQRGAEAREENEKTEEKGAEGGERRGQCSVCVHVLI